MINAIEYGRALFLLTEEVGSTERVREDVTVLIAAIEENPDVIKLLDTPAVSKAERLSVIDKILSSVDVNLCSLVKMLAEKREAHSLIKVLKAYLSVYDEARGIERVEAITAIPLSEEQVKRLTDRLAKRTGKTVIVTNTVDPSILGGIKLRYMGIQLDGSLKTRLDGFEKSLTDMII
ncbi:MAG: ATP synthase F1 subunit delta [Clostridia bacterium]|nr:ATP synthase F1 subunit delta [Clostridia bacterium]